MNSSTKKYRSTSYMNRTVPGLVALVICMLFLFSCKIGKQPVRRQVRIVTPEKQQRYGLITVDTVPGVTKPVPPSEPTKPAEGNAAAKQDLINKLTPLWQRQVSFNTFTGKAKCHYAGMGQKNEFTANIRVKKDQIIWINATALGGIVNVARIYITPDSIFLVNYLQRSAYKMPIADANKLLPAPVDFSIMQNLIIGNALKLNGMATDAVDFGGTLSIQTEDKDIIQQLTYNKADSSMRSLQMRTRDNQTEGMVQYGNYDMVSGRKFSTSRAISLNNQGEPYYLDMNFNNADFDRDIDFPFSIPKNYTVK